MGPHLDALVKWRGEMIGAFGTFQEFREIADLAMEGLAENDWSALVPKAEQIDAFISHITVLNDYATAISQVGNAMKDMNAGLRGMADAFGKDGENYVQMFQELSVALDGMSEALTSNADAYGLSIAAVGISRSVTQNVIKDLRARAAVEGAFQTALSAAAFATGNIPGGAAHAAAAALFFGVAAFGKSGKAVKKKDEPKLGAGSNMQVARSDVHVHIAGTVVQTEAERGAMIQRAIRESRARGR